MDTVVGLQLNLHESVERIRIETALDDSHN